MSNEPRRRGRPAVDPTKKAKPYAIKLPVSDADEIRDGAARLGISQARLIIDAVRAYLAGR